VDNESDQHEQITANVLRSAEFKDELCREVIDSSRPISEVAKAYGVGDDSACDGG
jgi:transposase-like protein